MANRYWLGNSLVWHDTNNWSTSDGGSPGASIPTSADDVYFTSLSANTCVMYANAECKSMTAQSGFIKNFSANGYDLYVAGDVLFSNAVGAIVFGSGSWLVDGNFDISAVGSVTYTDADIEFTGVAAATVYVHRFKTSSQRFNNVTISSGANVEIGSNGTSCLWQGAVDIYGTLTIPTSLTLGQAGTASSVTIRNGGRLTGGGTLIQTPTLSQCYVESGGTYDGYKYQPRYATAVSGVFDCEIFDWGNTALANPYTLTFADDTTINGDFTLTWTQVSQATIDLNTNAAEVRLGGDVDLSTAMTAGTLVIDDAAGKFKLIGSGDQSLDFGGKTVNLWANKWAATSTVTMDKSGDQIDIVADSTFGNLVLNGSYLNNGGNYDVDMDGSLTLTSGTFVSGTGTWTFFKNATINASATTTTWSTGCSMLFNSGTSQYLTVTGAAETFADLQVTGATTILYVQNDDAEITFTDVSVGRSIYLNSTLSTGDGRMFVVGTLTMNRYGYVQAAVGKHGSVIFSGPSAAFTTINGGSTIWCKPTILGFYNTDISLGSGYYRASSHILIYNSAGVDTIVGFDAASSVTIDTSITFDNQGGAGDVCTLDTTGTTRVNIRNSVTPSSSNKAECHIIGEVWFNGNATATIDMDSFGTLPTIGIDKTSPSTITFQNITTLTLASGTHFCYQMVVASTVTTFDANTNVAYITIYNSADMNCGTLNMGTKTWTLSGTLDVVGVGTLNCNTSTIRSWGPSGTLTVGAMAINPVFNILNVYSNSVFTVTNTSKEVYFNKITVDAGGVLANNVSSNAIRTHQISIPSTGIVNGTGVLYLTRTSAAHPVKAFTGDPQKIQCATVRFYGTHDMTITKGIWNGITNMIFWPGAIDFIFEGPITMAPSAKLEFRHLSTTNVNFDFTTNSVSPQVKTALIYLRDDSTGAMDFDATIQLVGTGNVDIQDDRDIASVTNEPTYSSAKSAGDIEIISGTAIFTDDVYCGSFTVSGTGEVDFNDSVVYCDGNMTLIGTPDMGESTIYLGGDYDIYNTTGMTVATSHVIMTGSGPNYIKASSSTVDTFANLTIDVGADIVCDTASSGVFQMANPSDLRVNGHLTFQGSLSSYLTNTNVYVSSTGQWTLTGTAITMMYSHAVGRGIQQMDGVIDGTQPLYWRGTNSAAVMASGTYDVPIAVYAVSTPSHLTLTGNYEITHVDGLIMYPDASNATTITLADNAELVTTTIKQSGSAGIGGITLDLDSGTIYLSGDMDLEAYGGTLTVTAEAGNNIILYGTGNQTVSTQTNTLGNIELAKPSGDVTISNTVATMSGTSEGGLTVS